MRPTTLVLALLGLMFFVSPALAQAQPRILILHEVPDDGYAEVGNPNQFGWILLGEDGTTNTHKNGKVQIFQNDVLLYETATMSSAHDYDALNSFLYALPTGGPYQVVGQVAAAGGLTLNSTFEGFATPRTDRVPAHIETPKMPATASQGAPTTFEFFIADNAGDLIPHTDALFEVRRANDNWLLFRTHLHTHEDAMSLDYAFAEAGAYVVRIVGLQSFPGKTDVAFEPVTLLHEIDVSASGPALDASLPGSQPEWEAATESESSAANYELLATYDPPPAAGGTANVGIYGNVRMNILVFDRDTKALVPHVNFDARLTDALGMERFSSKSLHEYDGNLEVIDQEQRPGTYTLMVNAAKGDWKATRELQFTASPLATPPGSAGPSIITATGLDNIKAGVPQEIEFSMKSAAGTPHMHSEIELQVMRGGPDGVPFLINKLHTHSDGLFGATITFPEPGEYTMYLDAETVHGDPTPSYFYERLGNPPIARFEVAPGVELPDVEPLRELPEGAGESEDAPTPWILGLLALTFVAVALRRRD